MKEKIVLAGWVLLSILLSFVAFILPQWLTIEGPVLINFISLFFSYFIFSKLSKYPFTGFIVFTVFSLGMLILNNALNIFHIIQTSFCLLGVITMILFKKKHYKSSIILFLTSVAYLILIKSVYLNHLNYEYEVKSDITILNENNNFLIGHSNEHPIFNSDTVYLVNFSFRNCLPCRRKKKLLKVLAKEYKHAPFKIIEIHSFESMEIFQEFYYFDHAVTYHDSINHLAHKLKIYGAPTEIIFNKKGNAVRRLNNFTLDAQNSYLQTTSELIKKLIHEKQPIPLVFDTAAYFLQYSN